MVRLDVLDIVAKIENVYLQKGTEIWSIDYFEAAAAFLGLIVCIFVALVAPKAMSTAQG